MSWRIRLRLLSTLCGVLAAVSVCHAAETPPENVLLVFSHERERWVYDSLERALRADIERGASRGLTVYSEYLETLRFDDEGYRKQVLEYFRTKYGHLQFKAVVPVSPLALDFVLDHRNDLFPRVPVVFASVNRSRIDRLSRLPDVTGVAVVRDLTSTLDVMLKLQPDLERVYIPAGGSAQERAWTEQARQSLEPYNGRVSIDFLTDLTLDELDERVARLPPQSALLSADLMFHDADGHYDAPEEILRSLCRSANAPVYSTNEAELGLGIVGGSLYDMAPVGAAAGALVRRVLAGEPVSRIPIQVLNPNAAMFDARELERWGIDERRLPAHAVVRFRAPSLWRDHRTTVVATIAVLFLQGVLILWLLYERRAREQAEMESRRNLSLAADAHRRATASALTNSIAHELRQPLAAITVNAAAADRLLTSARATVDEMREILADIRADNARASGIIERHQAMLKHHEVAWRPVDVRDIVRRTADLVAHDIRERQIDLDVDLPREPCPVVADPVLLQQVLVNLVTNAMDAMIDAPAHRRRLTLKGGVNPETVEIAVHDTGAGLPIAEPRFEPFATTKPNGLGIGLAISRTIVETHHGRLAARNNVDGGATFTVTLPRSNSSRALHSFASTN